MENSNSPDLKKDENKDEKRIKILVSAMILPITLSTHNPPFHVNIEMLENANTDQLREKWEYLYLSETKPMDVVVLSGPLEVPLVEEEEFVERVARFKRKVRKQNLENSFTFCELIRPPKYVRFPNTRDVMPENFVNHLDKINSINRVIKTFNNATRKTNSLSFASRGTRSRGTKRNSEGNLVYTSHKLSDWEKDGLDLNDRVKSTILKSIYKYFETAGVSVATDRKFSDEIKPGSAGSDAKNEEQKGVSVSADMKFSDEIKPSSAGSDATNEEQECNLCKDKNIKNNIFCLKCKICILCCMCKETIIN